MRRNDAERLVREFESAIDEPLGEESIHSFLAARPFLLNLHLPPPGGQIYGKVPLGSDLVTDFVATVFRTFGPTYYLFELEMSTAPLFTKKGDFSSTLSHAIRQILDWRQWIAEHREYAGSIMPGIADPFGVVLIGRRAGLRETDRKRLSQYLFDNGGKIDIVTYDRILDIARLNVHGRMTHLLGMQSRAFTFDDLRSQAPKITKDYEKYLRR